MDIRAINPAKHLPRPVTRRLDLVYQHMSQVERIALAWLTILLIASGFWSVAGFIRRNTELIPQSGGVYHEAAVGQPRYLNPILAGANDVDVDISRLIFSSLFKLDSNLELVNDLASDYTISEDKTRYTITLRRDATWHDGQPVTAADVVFTIRSIQTEDYGSPLTTAFQGVTVEPVDDYTISFQLRQPYAPFLSSLTVGIVPEHVWKDIAPKNASLAEQMLKPVGSGPFRFSEIKTRRKTGEITEIELVRNEAYYGQRPHLDAIAFTFFGSHEEAVDALATQSIDGVSFVPLKLYDKAERSSTVIHRLRLPQYFGLFLNQNNNPILSDAGVRNALSLATDRQHIVEEALGGEGEPLHLPLPPGLIAFNDEIPAPEYNPTAARQNLEDAGWRDADGDGIREKDNQRLHLKIATTDWPEYVHTAEIIQRQWQEIGVETEITPYGAGTIQQTILRPRDYEILLFGEILSADPDPYPFWHSTQTRSPGLNFALFKNEDVDRLLEEARKTHDINERREKYKQFQGIILDLKPAIILYRPLYLFATDNDVRGINARYAALTAGRFNNISDWHVHTKRIWK